MSRFKQLSIALVAMPMLVSAGSAHAQSRSAAFDSYLLSLIENEHRSSFAQLDRSDFQAPSLGSPTGQFMSLSSATVSGASTDSSSLQILFLEPRDHSFGQGGVNASIPAQAGSTFGSSSSMGMGQLENKTDPLTIIPLPSAAFAGMGMLIGIAGVNYLRKRK